MTYGIPVVGAEIHCDGEVYKYASGDQITDLEVRCGYETMTIPSCTIMGFALASKPRSIGNTNIFDGVAAGKFNPVCGMVSMPEEIFKITDMLVKDEDGKHRRIDLDDIVSVGAYVSPTGAVIEKIAPAEDGSIVVAEKIADIADGSVLKMEAGEIQEEVAVAASVTLKGSNAGVPQNKYQEV